MSTVPETIMARRLGLKVAALSVITNLGAGIKGANPSHEETKREGEKAAGNMKRLLTRFFRDMT
jgi:purine-nucleoside phosphorylase